MDQQRTEPKIKPRSIILCILFRLIIFSPLGVRAQAFSVPVSDLVLKVEMISPDSRTSGVAVHLDCRDGAMITVRDESASYRYGFAIASDRLNGKNVGLISFSLLPSSQGGESVRQLGKRLSGRIGEVIVVETPSGKFDIKVASVRTGRFLPAPADPNKISPDDLQKLYGFSGGGICCVTCGSKTVCSTSVNADCGNCASHPVNTMK